MRALTALLVLLVSFASALALAKDPPAQPRSRGEAKEIFSDDGLAKVRVEGIDVAYARAGASLAGYKSVLVRPISVSLRRDWKQSGGMTRLRASAEDIAHIRTRMSELVREEFDKDLQAAGIAQAQAPADDVLELDLSVTDLYAAAPELKQLSPRSETWALSAGSMTLVGELRDSVSGETLVRFYDHDTAREYSGPRRIEFGYNEIEARRIARRWAEALRAGVQRARAAGK
jgi:hypothetical protein